MYLLNLMQQIDKKYNKDHFCFGIIYLSYLRPECYFFYFLNKRKMDKVLDHY